MHKEKRVPVHRIFKNLWPERKSSKNRFCGGSRLGVRRAIAALTNRTKDTEYSRSGIILCDAEFKAAIARRTPKRFAHK
jgi:hypothetical protein